ncbi:hypothetical protein [Mesorhizobium sp.]|uniref:hypothetical protein n=1 Tax=Mesorhizobium sp. TaxID=1871066 RepID=UPI003BAAFCF5
MLASLMASGCSQATTADPPISTGQHAKLATLAAGPNAPEGLKEALVAAQAVRQMHDCQAGNEYVVRQIKATGAVRGAVGIAGGLAGSGGKAAAKAVAVGTAGVVRGKVSEIEPCGIAGSPGG